MIDIKDIYWVAGFLEGEGCFSFSNGCSRIETKQKQKQPLEKLMNLIGGSIILTHGSKNDIWKHSLRGNKAIQWMMTLFSLMSNKRQNKIREILENWKRSLGRNPSKFKTHCINGHEFAPENTHYYTRRGTGKYRQCKKCNVIRVTKYNKKIRNKEKNG